jgi:hypothetical protein
MKLFRFQFLGLPDLSTFVQHTKTEKMYQMTIQYTKCPQKDQMATKRPNGHEINQQLPLQDPPKFTQNWDCWFENIPSGIWQPCSILSNWKTKQTKQTIIVFFYI